MEKEDHDHPIEPSETYTLAEQGAPAGPKSSAPMLEWKFLIMPIGMLIFGAVLALGHHSFNAWEDGRAVANSVVPQDWVTRIGVGFSFGFKTAVEATMAFVVLQCLWVTVVRQPLTIQEIDTMYQVERQDQLYKTLPQALFVSPTIVIFSSLTLLLPLSGVFAPGSLTITTKNSTNIAGPCVIPTGNLSTPNTTDSTSLFSTGGVGYWNAVTPRATTLTTQWFVAQRIPDLPQACGPNCRYKVSVPSFVFQCTPNPLLLPYAQAQDPLTPSKTLWNGTTDPTSIWAFYIAWKSNGPNGTSGNASCSPVAAQYDVEVQTKEGVQSVTTNITQMNSPILDVTDPTLLYGVMSSDMIDFWMQLASLSYATRALFLGSAVLEFGASSTYMKDDTPASQASFVEIPVAKDGSDPEYIWGDVLKGIEEMSHNVTAALLTLQLGTMSAECLFDKQVVVYQYTSSALWTPYGTALGIALMSLVVAVMIMARNNTGRITTSFSDTIILTRNLDEDVSARAKLRLRAAQDGKLEYILE